MKCCIVIDLLPGYIDGLNSEETNEEIEKHLDGCTSCRTIYRQMSAEIPNELPAEKRDIDFLKKLRKRIRRKYAVVALSTCVVLIGSTVFLKNYNIPVPYDPDCMTTELYEIAYVPNHLGLNEWQYQGPADTPISSATDTANRNSSEPSGSVMAENPNSEETLTKEQIRFVLSMSQEKQKSLKINNFISKGRTIRRDGRTIRIVYYCYTKTMWNNLFPNDGSFVNSLISEGDVFEETFYRNANTDYQPKFREIYYLPMGNMNKLESLSDEEFDAQREKAALVWSGVI